MKEWFQQFRIAWKASRHQRKRIRQLVLLIGLVWYVNCLPDNLFSDSTSTVLLDRNGNLLGAKIAADGQWRFPENTAVPAKMAACLIEFEDRDFRSHVGISAKGIGRALVQNFKSKRIVSGGSTITMQLARIMRGNPPRTYAEKILEMVLATRMEVRYSKDEILGLYASHAPCGNNVVGLDAASWRYFGRSAQQLSWGESATLAVLPNAPGLIYPGRNPALLREKRNRLLKRLFEHQLIDATEFELALSEPLPEKPLPLPQLAPHLLNRFMQQGQKGKLIVSTLDAALQEKAVQQLSVYSTVLQENQIMNGALLITSVKTGKILAYVGNVPMQEAANGKDVDCIQAPRSTGSILKPLLYAKSMENGTIAPQQLLTDIPSQFGSFAPKNYSGQFDGALPAHKALSRSLNIPLVHLLNSYGVTKFHGDLKTYGLTTIHQPARHYGLSLILGGAEATLFDLNRVYTQMAQELAYGASKPIVLIENPGAEGQKPVKVPLKTDRGCIYSTFEALV
jgi:penicillin-binding protein 1C